MKANIQSKLRTDTLLYNALLVEEFQPSLYFFFTSIGFHKKKPKRQSVKLKTFYHLVAVALYELV